MTRSSFPVFVAIGFGLCLAAPRPVCATLGERGSSVAADRQALGAAHRATTTRASYTVQEIASPSSTVREYLNSSGVVFAVAWNGLRHPDLTTLLGSYAAEFKEAKERTPRVPGHRQMQVSGNSVVVQTWGHMRDLHGRAYVPALLPPGVTIDEIQ